MLLAKIVCQRVQQVRMGGLQLPWCWGRMIGILPCQIPIQGWIDNANGHELGPDKIDRDFGKLLTFRHHTSEFVPWVESVSWFCAVQNERRKNIGLRIARCAQIGQQVESVVGLRRIGKGPEFKPSHPQLIGSVGTGILAPTFDKNIVRLSSGAEDVNVP